MCQMSTFLKGELKAQFILRFSLHLCVSVKTKMCQISPKFGGLQEKVANIAPQLAKVCAKPPPSQNSTGMPRQTLTFRRHHSQSLQCQSIHCQTYNRPRNSVLFKCIECLNSINNLYSNLSFINKHIRTFFKTLCKLQSGLVASE